MPDIVLRTFGGSTDDINRKKKKVARINDMHLSLSLNGRLSLLFYPKNCRFVRGCAFRAGVAHFRVEQIFGAGVRGFDSAILGKRAKRRREERN